MASIAARHAKRRVEDGEQSEAWWPRMLSFSIGLVGSPDLAAAARVAKHLGTVHHAMTFTVQQGIDALEDLIFHLETYDVTTVRAATPMYLMARKIKAMGCKMVRAGVPFFFVKRERERVAVSKRNFWKEKEEQMLKPLRERL